MFVFDYLLTILCIQSFLMKPNPMDLLQQKKKKKLSKDLKQTCDEVWHHATLKLETFDLHFGFRMLRNASNASSEVCTKL